MISRCHPLPLPLQQAPGQLLTGPHSWFFRSQAVTGKRMSCVQQCATHTHIRTDTTTRHGKNIRFADHRLYCDPLTGLSVSGQSQGRGEERMNGEWMERGDRVGKKRMWRQIAKNKKERGRGAGGHLIREDTGKERRGERQRDSKGK